MQPHPLRSNYLIGTLDVELGKGGDASYAAHEAVYGASRSVGGNNSGFCRPCRGARRLVVG